MTAPTRLKSEQIEKIKGLCFGCAHAAPRQPFPGSTGTGRYCLICVRNPAVEKGVSLKADSGEIAYGARDCYIATDRLEMDLKMVTFLSAKSGKSHG